MALPSESILQQFTTYTSPESGFNPDILQSLMRETKLGSASHYKRNVALVYDKMKISANLVYSRGSGRLRGFLESGTINQELEALHRKLEDTQEVRPMAKYVNVFMARGLLSDLCYPFGYFAGKGGSYFQLCGKQLVCLSS